MPDVAFNLQNPGFIQDDPMTILIGMLGTMHYIPEDGNIHS
jgi:hypothetical protein